MNILVLTYNQEPIDGWSVVSSNIINELSKMNSIEIFSREENAMNGYGYKKLKVANSQSFLFFRILRDLINIVLTIKIRPDIIYSNVEYYAPVAMFLSQIYKIPYVQLAHGTYGVLLPKKYSIYKKAFLNANKLICVSNFTKRRMIQEEIKANYKVILNGVDKSVFKLDEHIKKENIITFVGNLKKRKGLSFLLDTMVEVNKENLNIKIVVIGNIDFSSSDYINTLNFINKNNLNVEFTGKINEAKLVNYYQKAKLNILPSMTDNIYFEGFGLIHAEANACGTLTIGTKNSGNEDAIYKGNGYLIDYGNINQLSSYILDTFSRVDYPKIDQSKVLTWAEVSNQYIQIFNEVVDNND